MIALPKKTTSTSWQPKYLHFLTIAFVVSFITSNILAFKVVQIGGLTFGAAAIFFPISLIIGDIMSEVYGYKRTRRAVFIGLIAYCYFVLAAQATTALPAAPQWPLQPAYEAVFGMTVRVFIAGVLAYMVAELVNAYILTRMKVWQKGKSFWLRAMTSTIAGEFLHTAVGAPIVFWNILSGTEIIQLVLTATCLKVAVEAVILPFTSRLVVWLKNAEQIDYYER